VAPAGVAIADGKREPMFLLRGMAKILIVIVAAAAVAAGGLYMFGSRTEVDTTLTFDPAAIGADLDAYLEAREADVAGLRSGEQKQIVWADPASRAQTDLAIVYIHGFSASSAETRPFADLVARNLGANLFFTRLTGHGATSAAMGRYRLNDWFNDFAEAMAIGRRLGKRVVILASSTGASLATWGLQHQEFGGRIDAVVFVSPNYRINSPFAFLLTVPGARQIAHLVFGDNRSFVPANAGQAAHWTHIYPVEALLPMAKLVKRVVNGPIEAIRIPAYMMISPEDTVVSPAATRAVAARWGGPSLVVEVQNVGDPDHHVLVGDIMSPKATMAVVAATTDWLKTTLRLP
jgi:pimeloyl-ACP methyl ester carboxylesterase